MATLRTGLIWMMAIACGVAVANLYYNQPMLVVMGRSIHASARQMGIVATLTQVGYGLGMLLFVPLGDLLDRKRLATTLMLAAAAALAAAALAASYPWLATASLAIGLTTVVAQVLIPLAAHLAEPRQRGKVIGSLYSGLLIGILLARTISGFVAAHLGWREMYWIACGMSLIVAAALAIALPHVPRASEPDLTYPRLLRSLWRLARTQSELREACIIGAMVFASFSAFWTTLVFFLSTPPYHYGSQAAGLFGLVGATGVFAAPVAGRLSDRAGPRLVVAGAVVVTLLSWAAFWVFGHTLWGLVAGVILLDLGVQAAQVSNQTRVLGLVDGAQARVNTVYMIAYFSGGSLGSLAGAYAWTRWGWPGVCATGIALATLALLASLRGLLLCHFARTRPTIHPDTIAQRCGPELPVAMEPAVEETASSNGNE